jgi:radical SAM superfamily enzyme YgiQ (UPF0313 family)
LGIESGDQDVLKIMKKVATPDQYLRGMKLLNANGIMTFASLIIGSPGKLREVSRTPFSCCRTLDDVFPRRDLVQTTRALPSTPKPGTSMESLAWISVATQYNALGAGLRNGVEVI